MVEGVGTVDNRIKGTLKTVGGERAEDNWDSQKDRGQLGTVRTVKEIELQGDRQRTGQSGDSQRDRG